MTDQLKYGRVERERRWLLAAPPSLEWDRSVCCTDRYLTGTRLRLRKMADVDGPVAYKLARKLAPQAPGVGVMGNLYLAANEHVLFEDLPADVVHKQMFFKGDWRVDVFGGALTGLVTAEIECDDARVLAALEPPFDVVRDVTADPTFGGAALAKRVAPPLEALTHGWLAHPQFDEARQALAKLPATVEHAAAWMVTLHRHQAPRHDGRPYLSHPAEVALRVAEWGGDDDQIAAALLHDALEDQAARICPDGNAASVLQTHMGPEVCRLVQALTHPSGATGYLAYIQSLPPRALEIKVADLSTNALRIDHVEDDARRDYLTRKYAAAMCWLAGRLSGHPAQESFQTAVRETFGAIDCP